MNSNNYNRKVELYNELSGLLSLKRKQGGQRLSSFVSIYLSSLTPYKQPLFHKNILKEIEATVISPTISAIRVPMEHHFEDRGNMGAKTPLSTQGHTDTRIATHKDTQDTTSPPAGIDTNTIPIHLNTTKDSKTSTQDDTRPQEEGMMTPPSPRCKDSYKEGTDNSDIFLNSKNNLDVSSVVNNRLLFIAPRGFAKSTICSRFFPLWLALYGKKTDILLISSTVALAKDNLRIIKDQIASNDKLIEDFGDMKSDKWTEEEIILTNGVRIRAKGRGFQIRGLRPDIIICDDLEDDDIVASKEQREKLETWFLRTLLPTLKPDQHLVYIGTKLHQFALISKLQEKKEFKSYHYKAIVQVNGEEASIWEDMWPITRLKELREEIGVYAFESEYQNNPLSLKEQPIKPHHINDVRSRGQIVEAVMSIDPAISERENADYSAIQIMGKTEDGEFRELLTVKGRWGIEEQVDKVIDLYVKYNKKWNILRILLEEVAYQKVLRPLLIAKSRTQGVYLPISTAELGMGHNKRPKDKRTRLMQVVHLFEARLVEITNPDTKIELLSFPFGDYDDTVDVTVYNLYWLIHNRPGKYMYKKQKEGLPFETKKSFFVEEIRPGVFATKWDGIPSLEIKSNLVNYDK